MSIASVQKILHLTGSICINPTNLASDFPHGGTAIGLTRGAECRFNVQTSLVRAEEWGGAPVESFYTGESAVFAFVLRTFDNDGVAAIFPNTSTGSVSGDTMIDGRTSGVGVNRAGYALSNKSVKLLFSPKSVNLQPMVLGRKAVPMIEESAMLQMSVNKEIGFGVVFQAIPDSSGKLYEIGLKEDLTL